LSSQVEFGGANLSSPILNDTYYKKGINMKTENSEIVIAEEIIISKIYNIRGKRVMLAQDLAELYQVETKVLNKRVKRNAGHKSLRIFVFSLLLIAYTSYLTLQHLNLNLSLNLGLPHGYFPDW
jgi:hypothetical protein